jgi:hypothetical protein
MIPTIVYAIVSLFRELRAPGSCYPTTEQLGLVPGTIIFIEEIRFNRITKET